MSDLIDFASPICSNPKTNGSKLPSPLIPAPTSISTNYNNVASCDLSESCSNERCRLPDFSPHNRRSFENNPFDVIMKQVTEYERNREDPFERLLIAKEDGAEFKLRKTKPQLKNETDSDDVATVIETQTSDDVRLVKKESDISIITDLNDTNLISDQPVEETNLNLDQVLFKHSDNNDKNNIPVINVLSSCSNHANLSILNDSFMNDSLLGSEFLESNHIKSKSSDKAQSCCRSISQSDYLSVDKFSPNKKDKRSVSVIDSLKNSAYGENSYLSCLVQSNVSYDPLNNAFRKSCLINSDSSIKDKFERLNSDNSVSSKLSNVSSISMNSSNLGRLERFCSESSTSRISNLSIIPSNTSSLSSFELSLFPKNILDKAFIDSRLQLDSVNFINTAENNNFQKANDKSDIIENYYKIKKKMSYQIESINNENFKESLKETTRCSSLISDKEDCAGQLTEKLVDINSSSNSVFSDANINDIIVNEAKALAETLEKLASSGESNSNTGDDLFFSQIELNFDDLPPSDDETVDNLIDLPRSPQKLIGTEIVEKVDTEQNETTINKNVKVLENEFIDRIDSNKKAVATTLLLDLQKILNKESNPEASKVLDDLQKILGVKCDSNTEILKNCLQNTGNYNRNENHFEFELHMQKNYVHCVKSKDYNGNSQDKMSAILQSEIVDNENNKSDEMLKIEINNDETETKDKDVLSIIKKIVHKKDDNDVADFVNNFHSVLSMAAELPNKNAVTHETKIIPKLPNLSFVSNSFNKKLQNKFLGVSSQQKSNLSVELLNSSNLNILPVKDENKSNLLSSRRFASDQNIPNKKKTGSVIEPGKFHLSTTNKATESIKSRFKKKTEIIIKKGPLKAMIPVGNMQKQGSSNQRISIQVTVTPPKLESIPQSIPSNTPNPSRNSKNDKSNPKASSTPNAKGPKKSEEMIERRRVFSLQKSFKSSSADNLPSISSSLRRSDLFKTNKGLDRTLSPQKKLQTPKRNMENGTESRLPRYSPRPVRMRNYSFGDIRTVDHKSPKKLTPKILTEKKFKRSMVLSPLRNFNKLEQKPMHLIPSLERSSIPTGPGKENYV